MITHELRRRPAQKDFAAENRALSVLALELAQRPGGIQQKLAELVLELCHADSAGLSLLEPGPPEVFRWVAVAGEFAPNVGGTIPREDSPCGVVVERNEVLLFRDSELHFPRLRAVKPVIYESLLAPFDVEGKPGGTVWAVKHQPGGRFNAEDARALESLSRFAAAAHQAAEARARAERASEAAATLHPRLVQVSKMAVIGETTAGVAHELNQPLTAIANYAQAGVRLLSRPEVDLEELRTALNEINSQALRAGDIIRGLRELAAPRLERAHADPNEAVKEVMELLRADARAHGVQIVLRLANDLQPVKIERTQIQHVVLNLLRNALEALESVPGKREVVIGTRNTPEGLELSVSDNGPGLPQDVRARMFDPFFSTKASGTGLGLTISHSLIRAHGGRLIYEPCPGGGACFRICLPPSSDDERSVI